MRRPVEPIRPGLREMESLASPPVPGLRPRVIAAQPGEESGFASFEHSHPHDVRGALRPAPGVPPQDYYEPAKSPPATWCVGGPAWSKAQGSGSCPVGVRRFKSCPTHQVKRYDGCIRWRPRLLVSVTKTSREIASSLEDRNGHSTGTERVRQRAHNGFRWTALYGRFMNCVGVDLESAPEAGRTAI
jgi:hypothetical protein